MLLSLLGVGLVVALGDRISVELFKEVFLRYRPSHNFDLNGLVHHVDGYRGGKYGFVSSHATNFFGIATFVFLLIRKEYLGWGIAIFFWAGLICYTRIYLGVHYPGDLFAGGLLGAVIGWFVYRLFKKFHLDKLPK
jgi:undecaprenyl-diphosphatase